VFEPLYAPLPATFDSRTWLRRWDAQQAGYLPDREERFTAMLDALDVLLPSEFVAVDLCCGPGSLSERLLARFPQARVIAIDYDPALLALGRAALVTADGRLRWVDGDLMEPATLPTALGSSPVDAVLSTTALHWLPDEDLRRVYQQLADHIRPGGVLLNGDNLQFPASQPTLQHVSDVLTERFRAAAFQARGVEDWEEWWGALAREPGLPALIAERERRFQRQAKKEQPTSVETHIDALTSAGFREAGILWQHLDNMVVMAMR
jgi:trans-aconitate methyltransferase